MFKKKCLALGLITIIFTMGTLTAFADDSADNPPMKGEANTTATGGWGTKEEEESLEAEVQKELEQFRASKAAEEESLAQKEKGRIAFYTTIEKENIPTDCIMISLINEAHEFVHVALERERSFFTSEQLPAGKYILNEAYPYDREKGTDDREKGKFTVKAFINGEAVDGNEFVLTENTNNTVVQVFLDTSYEAPKPTIPDKEDVTEATTVSAEEETDEGSLFNINRLLLPILGGTVAGVLLFAIEKKIKNKEK